MGLLSFFQRDKAAAPAKGKSGGRSATAADPDDVQQLRVRARRRLIGAAVLVAIGVIGFPLIFETQPRPIPVDLPIEIPKKEAAAPLAVPPPPPTVAASEPATAPASIATPTPEPAPAVAQAVEKPAEKPAAKATEKPPEMPTEKVLAKPSEKVPAPKAAAQAESARIQALLEGRDSSGKANEATNAPRFIVQVGAFAENKSAQDMRLKVEKLGFKTYAQAVQTPAGQRIRVRVGTFPSRDEANKAAAKLHAAGLAGTVLTL